MFEALRIIDGWGVVADRHSSLSLRPEPVSVEKLTFEHREDQHNIPSRSTDARGQLGPLPEGDRGILRFPIGVIDHFLRTLLLYGYLERTVRVLDPLTGS